MTGGELPEGQQHGNMPCLNAVRQASCLQPDKQPYQQQKHKQTPAACPLAATAAC